MGVQENFTKYERARIIGARALQISMDAPLLVKFEKGQLEEIRFDPIKIAELELDSDVLPITVKRPLPKKIEGKLKKEKEIPIKKIDSECEKAEEEIIKDGEIMELAKPEDGEEEETVAKQEPEI